MTLSDQAKDSAKAAGGRDEGAGPGSGSGWSPSTLTALAGGRKAAAPPAQSEVAVDVESQRKAGFDAGFAEGLAAGRAESERVAAELRSLLEAMAEPFRESDATLLRELLDLTERISRAVIGRELQAGIDLEAVLNEALAALGSSRVPVQLVLNPADAALCREQGLVSEEHFELRESGDMPRGSLHLKSGTSFVDASVESRLEATLAALRQEAGLPEDESAQPAAERDPGADA